MSTDAKWERAVREIHDILFPPDEPDKSWDADTLAAVDAVVQEVLPSLTFEKNVALVIDKLLSAEVGTDPRADTQPVCDLIDQELRDEARRVRNVLRGE